MSGKSGLYARFFPDGFVDEAKAILKLTLPIALTSVITFIMGPISTLFCGHYHSSKDSLALPVVGCAISVFNVFGMVFPTGMLTACDTFFAQTYGSKDKSRMGIQLQRAFLIAFLICIPSFTMFLCVQPILLMLKQPPNIVKLVDDYLLYMYPGFVGASLTIVFQKFVQAQNHVYGPLIIGFTANSVNALLHYILLYRFDVGLKGSAISQSISYWINIVMYIGLFFMNKFHKKYWNGFQKEVLSDWNKWFALAIPGLIMIGLEWWIFEIGTFIAGSEGQLELASQTIIFQLETIAFTSVPFGFGIAASIRTGQALGSGNARGPISTKNVGIFICWCFTLIFIVLFTFFRNYMPMIFSDNQKVIDYTAKILPLLAIFQFFDAFIGVCGGVVRGAGMQQIGAAICIIGLYVFALPLSIVLMKFTELNIAGYWTSLCVGTVIEGIAYLVISARINWPRQVELAAKRCAISTVEEVETPESIQRNNASFRKIIINRIILVLCFFGVLGIGIAIRYKLDLRQQFGVYCIFKNETFVQIPWYSDSQPIPYIPQNCTLFYP